MRSDFPIVARHEPYIWFLKIGEDGLAHEEKATKEEFFAFRRKCYPGGYIGWGLIDEEDRKSKPFWRIVMNKLNF